MPKINVLSREVSELIAAGEVIDRPASIVKELLENAIDAGANVITVEIKNGGRTYIRITDNGCGIASEDVPTAFLRHATSKIANKDDLSAIGTLGFRGEALASVCAVAKVSVLTKRAEDKLGTRYEVNGSEEIIYEPAGCPDGTTFIIRDIFFNTPARLKFLKSPKTEGGYVIELIENLMLSHPDISFKLIVNGTTKLQSSGNGSYKDVIYSIYGRDVIKAIIPIEISDGNNRIEGFIGKPELSRGNRNFEIYFVNGRYIRSKLIERALDEAYRYHLMLHKFPMVFLNIELPSSDIDVNVHPSKMEIKFLEGERLYAMLVEGIREALSRKELIPELSEDDKDKTGFKKEIPRDEQIPEPFEKNRREDREIGLKNAADPFLIEAEDAGCLGATERVILTTEVNNKMTGKVSESGSLNKDNLYSINYDKTKERDDAGNEQLSLFEDKFLSASNIKKHRLIGQLFDTYWLIEFDDKLYIMDQHAAHEKVKYERFLRTYREGNVSSQNLNPPIIISLSRAEEEFVDRYSDNFAQAGFEIEPFGGNEIALRAVPVEMFGLSEADYFHEMLDDLMQGKLAKESDSVNLRIATMGCKAAVKGNTRMSFREADALISELLTLDNPYNCPHGRPTLVSYSKYEVDKMFKRIVS